MRVIAIDTETKLIGYPDQANPDMVCFTWDDGDDSGIIHVHDTVKIRQFLGDLFSLDCIIIGHNISFDLHVILKQFPEFWPAVWRCLRAGLIKDTMLRERLYLLSTEGDVTAKPAQLADLVLRYLGNDISDTKGEDAWRMRYEELLPIPVEEWPKAAVDYAVYDATSTRLVYLEQKKKFSKSGPGSVGTEDIQVVASFALRGMEIQGIRIDTNNVDRLREELTEILNKVQPKLRRAGIVRENGTQDKKVLARWAEKWGVDSYTNTGKLSTSMKTLGQLNCNSVVYKAYMEYAKWLKAINTFIPQMSYSRIHPRYNPIVNTGRTSCMASDYYKSGKFLPSINLQQIPRDARFRKAFIPEEGMLFVCADYCNLELVCAAQTYKNLVGYSKMGEVLNSGENLHTYLGRTIYNDIYNVDVSLEDYKSLLHSGDKKAKMARQSAKPVNLGCPGGQSAKTIQRTAQETYGMPITLEQATKWRDIARNNYSEMSAFFDSVLPMCNTGYMVVKNDDGVYKKVARYDAEICGMFRAKMTYTSASNGICMQTPGAIGKKLALIEAYERSTNPDRNSSMYGSVLHIDMHDEILLSAPVDKVQSVERELAECMIEQMTKVLPDMRVATESMIMRRWGKDPEEEFGSQEFSVDNLKVNMV